MKLKIKHAGTYRHVEAISKECINKPCFHPHDCPVQGARGVRSSEARWMCLTNVLSGCPSKEGE